MSENKPPLSAPILFTAGILVTMLAAWIFEGGIRHTAVFLQVLMLLGITWIVSAKSRGISKQEFLQGAAYRPPRTRRSQITHLLATLLFGAALVLVVLGVMARLGFIPIQWNATLAQGFPVFMGILALAVGLGAYFRLEEDGNVVRSPQTVAHGWVVFFVALPVLLFSAWLILLGEVNFVERVWLLEEDVVILVLILMMSCATQILLAANLPNVANFTLLLEKMNRDDGKQRDSTPPFIYAGIIAIAAVALLGLILSQFNWDGIGQLDNQRLSIVIVLVPVAVALFFLIAGIQIYRESRRGLYVKKLSSKVRNDILVYGLSSLFGLFFATLLALNIWGRFPDYPNLPTGTTLSKDLLMLAILTSFGPIGMYRHAQHRRIDAIEERLPDFLNDLAETRRAGLTMAAALQTTALADYGPLSKEIRKMADQVSWGIPFVETARQFAERVPTSLVQRSMYLIIEATKTGGSVTEILKAAAKDAYELKALESERKVSMLTYLIVIYVVFFVFLLVIGILDAKFIPQLIGAQEATAIHQGGSVASYEELNFVYYTAIVMQAVGNGIVGGVLSEKRVTAGFRHVAIMTLCGWAVFRFIL